MTSTLLSQHARLISIETAQPQGSSQRNIPAEAGYSHAKTQGSSPWNIPAEAGYSHAKGSHLPDSLVVESFTGYEAVNALFSFDIQALSVSASIDLKPFIGEEITLRLLQADGSKRAWHGYCTEA